jgi:hypothetical protein
MINGLWFIVCGLGFLVETSCVTPPLSHTFCTGCLRDMYRKTDKPIANNIRCPNCNKDTPFPVPNQVDVETDFVSQHLPKNYLLCQVCDCLHYNTNLLH